MDVDEESKSLEEACTQFRNKTWYIFRHAHLSEAAYREILQAMKTKDKIPNFILFQRKHDAFILHSCQRPSAIKCKCLFYNQLRPPVVRVGKQNMSMLTAVTNIDLFREMLQALCESKNHDLPYECSIKIVRVNGVAHSIAQCTKCCRKFEGQKFGQTERELRVKGQSSYCTKIAKN